MYSVICIVPNRQYIHEVLHHNAKYILTYPSDAKNRAKTQPAHKLNPTYVFMINRLSSLTNEIVCIFPRVHNYLFIISLRYLFSFVKYIS